MPRLVQRLRIVEFTLDHEAPYVSNMRRRNSRRDSDLNGVFDVRYTGGARMLLALEVGEGRWRFKVPVLVSDLDLECALWLKLRLAPMCPWIGTISLAFVGPPAVKVQLSPYNRVRLMRVPVLQSFLTKLLTVDLPELMVLPKRLEINIPPSVTSIAEAAVGRDTIMRAVASAVLQVDSLEQALLAALPLGPQTPAGGVTLPDFFAVRFAFAVLGVAVLAAGKACASCYCFVCNHCNAQHPHITIINQPPLNTINTDTKQPSTPTHRAS